MLKDTFNQNPLIEFLSSPQEKNVDHDKLNQSQFDLRSSELQLLSLEESLTKFLAKSKKEQRLVAAEFDDFFVEMSESIFEDCADVLNNMTLNSTSVQSVDNYLKQIHRVYGLLNQVIDLRK